MAQYGVNAGPGQNFQPGVSVNPTTQVELRIACRNLRDMDITSKSDPMCVVYLKEMYSDRFVEVARTEVIKNSLNPDFVKPVQLNYSFEEHQKLRFMIYDYDVHSPNLSRQDYLGQAECSLGEIVACQGTQFRRALSGLRYASCGTIIVSADEVGGCKEVLTLQFSATNLDKKDLFGKSDPYLVLSKLNPDNSLTVVHKTEVIKNTLNPTWRAFSVPVRVMCNGDLDRTIQFQCFDWDSDGGSHDFIGEFKTTARRLMKGQCQDNFYECINPKKKAKKSSYKNSGVVRLNSCRIDKEYSFLEFIKGGLQMHFTVAVDFTGSNGDPKSPNSLHYIHPTIPNSYAVAIRAVGEIIQDYDVDRMFPALGFGARIPPHGTVSHEFFLNGQPSNPYCQGVDGILEHYYRTVRVVQLYGPTNFAPSINHVARIAANIKDGSSYFTLLIITDGIISDMPDTKRAIVYASSLPMSIIIVGVGQADFQAMEELDGDTARICSPTGEYAQRDIVQFVPFRDFQNQNSPWQQSQARLAKEVLAEIPNQVVDYMKKRSIVPKPAPIIDPSLADNVSTVQSTPQHQAAPQVLPTMAPASATLVSQAAPPPHQQTGQVYPNQSSNAPYPAPQSQYPSNGGQPGAPYGSQSGASYPNQTTNAPYPPTQSPYPSSQSHYPPSQSPYPPSQSSYPPSQSHYPPSQSPYPPSQSAYPPSQSPYPPSQSPYPPSQSAYPPSQSAYPPSQSAYPPSQSAYPSSQSAYPPSQSAYPPSQSAYPPSQYPSQQSSRASAPPPP